MRLLTKQRAPRREHIPCPQTAPILNIVGNGAMGGQILTFADPNHPDSRSRPKDAKGLQLCVALRDEGTAPLSEATMLRLVTRNPIVVQYERHEDGKVATYYGRWESAKGETGPWSLPVSMRVACPKIYSTV